MSSPIVPASLADSAARGVLWTGAGQVVRQLIQVGSSVILVRLLSPGDFGLIGMAMFFVGIGQLLADFGVGSAIVHSRAVDRVVLSSCFWLNVIVAAVLAALVLGFSPLIGSFYERRDLVPIVEALSLNLLLSGLQVVPSALLYRDLRFADLARAQVLGSLAGALAAMALAWAGFGVWALVAQPLVGSTANLLVCTLAQRWYPRLEFSWAQTAPLARFSAALLGTNIVGYMNRNVDSLLVGRVLGAGPLGYYSMAIQLMLYPLQQVSSVIVRVLFPTLVQIRDDLPRLRSAYLKAVASIALITFPIMGGLFALADDFVLVVFGPQWVEMAPLLKVLAWVGMMQSVGTTVGTIYLSMGNPGVAFRVTLVGAPVFILGLAAGLPWGIFGVAVGYAVASFSLFYYTTHTAFRFIDLTHMEFHRVLLKPLGAALAMVAALHGLAVIIGPLTPAGRLAVGVLAGTLIYLAVSALINRGQLLEIASILRSLRRRSRHQ
jgi:O-antigen/teichoic acid export membrane protein